MQRVFLRLALVSLALGTSGPATSGLAFGVSDHATVTTGWPGSVSVAFAQDLPPDQLIAQGRSRDAVPALEAARDRARRSGRHDAALAVTLNNLGSAYYELSRYRDAQRAYEESLAVRRKLGQADSPELARTLSNLGTVYLDLELIKRAEKTLEQAVRALDRHDPNGMAITAAWINLGTAYQSDKRYDEAADLFQRALAVREKKLGSAHRDVATALNNLGVLYRDRHRLKEAQPLLERAVSIWENALGPEHPQIAASLHNLAVVYAGLDLPDRAREYFERAVKIAEKTLPGDHPNLATYRSSYALLLNRMGNKVEARRLEELARQGLKSSRAANLLGYTVEAGDRK